jgi:hypothetical protein
MATMGEYSWECPKCGEILEGLGSASLNFLRHNHEYWEHERPAKLAEAAKQRNLEVRSYMPDVLVDGVAALDDAYFDGARLSTTDHGFLRAMKVCWSVPKRNLLRS